MHALLKLNDTYGVSHNKWKSKYLKSLKINEKIDFKVLPNS